MTHVVRYITHMDVDFYRARGWRCSYYGERGDNLDCFIASWLCCGRAK